VLDEETRTMCGIIGYIGHQAPKNILLDGLKRLEYRGYDSAGLAILEKGATEVYRCEGRIQGLETLLSDHTFTGSVGIGHTRWATHGAPSESNAHPHQVGAVTLVHNGIIENYLTHKAALVKLGRTIKSDTDSEIVAHLIDSEVQMGRSLEEAVRTVLPRLTGSYAFVILSDREPDLLIGVRNGAPLLLGMGKGESYIASDVQAILHRTNRIVYLKDREVALCRREKVRVKSADGTEIVPEIKEIHWTPEQMEKLGYRHYMLKEIHEQQQAMAQTIEGNVDQVEGVVDLQGLKMAPGLLEGIKKICIVACGTARHAGLVGKNYIEQFAKIPVDVDYASEFRYRDPLLDKSTLVLLVSQSGETADTLAACQEAKAKGARVLSIVNVHESSLARESGAVLYTNAGPEIGVASTKAFTTQVVMLYMFALELGFRNGCLSKEASIELTRDLIKLPILAGRVLQCEKQMEQIALEHQANTFFFYMGRGILYPIALEGALKLKEISYLNAEGYAAGELKHGPIALIDRRTAIIVLSPDNAPYEYRGSEALNKASRTIYEKTMSNLQEVKSRGGQIFSVGSEDDETFERESKFFVSIPRSSWALSPVLLSIPVQFLAYYIALQRGTDVDKPRNLAKSVTVE
jgi:glutamine---fructose-6-phosphate transaminase (isomerizing)